MAWERKSSTVKGRRFICLLGVYELCVCSQCVEFGRSAGVSSVVFLKVECYQIVVCVIYDTVKLLLGSYVLLNF